MEILKLDSKKHGRIFILYDSEDHDLISEYNWFALKNGNGIYAMSTVKNPTGKATLMHRLIMGVTDPKILVDHKNRCTTDNTRGNLRIATKSQNAVNSGLNKCNRSGYKGVDLIHRKNGMYRARIQFNGKNIHIGMYKTAFEAAQAYNQKAIELFGDYAYINYLNF